MSQDEMREILQRLESVQVTIADFHQKHITLINDYIAGLRYRIRNLPSEDGSEANRPTISQKKITENNAEGYSCSEDNDEISSSSVNSRGERKAARIASIKVKKNLNIPLKLRQPSTGDIYEGTLRDHENNNVPVNNNANNQSRANQTRVIKKCKTEALPSLQMPDQNGPVTSESNDAENKTDVPESTTPQRPPRASPPKLTPSSVKYRAMQFENLAAQSKKPVANNLASLKTRLNNVNKTSTASHNAEPTAMQVSPDSTKMSVSPNPVNTNSTFTVQPTNSTDHVPEVTRVTRAMAQNSKKDCSGTSSKSDSSAPSTGSKSVKRSSVSLKCKKSLKAFKPKRSAKKKSLLQKAKPTVENKSGKSREDRLNKVRAVREAKLRKQHETEVAAQLKKAEKMKMIAAEKEKQQKEEEAKKAALAKQKKIEMEERRKREEAARLARLEEIEEEHRRAEAAVKKKREETEAIRQKKLEQELKAAATKSQLKEKPRTPLANNKTVKAANVTHTIIPDPENYDMTPDRKNRVLKNPKTAQDYGIDEAGSSDSSEDEEHPKKKIPSWAERKNRALPITINSHVPLSVWKLLYKCDTNPQINTLLGVNNCKRLRTSSAIWTTPPLPR